MKNNYGKQSYTKLDRPAQIVCIGGILSAFAILFQASPVFLPGIGLLLSPLATLPIAIAAALSVYLGITALFATFFILLLISPQEAFIFILTTGSLGVSLGGSHTIGLISSILISGGTLFIGVNILTYAVGLSVFGDMTPDASLLSATLIFLIFSICYSFLWVLILRFFIRLLKKIRQFSIFISNKSDKSK